MQELATGEGRREPVAFWQPCYQFNQALCADEMACVQVSTKELSTANSLPSECFVIVELYCIMAFISMYCFWERNVGINYSLKLLTSISLTPNTLLALY